MHTSNAQSVGIAYRWLSSIYGETPKYYACAKPNEAGTSELALKVRSCGEAGTGRATGWDEGVVGERALGERRGEEGVVGERRGEDGVVEESFTLLSVVA